MPDMTDEQKANIDKALGKANISQEIGGASEAGSKPVPNDPQPLEKARDVGQDLHKQGVTVEK
jgi:hypothetical protein